MDKPYSDSRWHDNPKPIDSECNQCKYYKGFVKCKHHKDKIPSDILIQSFPNTEHYNKNYCKYRKEK